MVETLQFPGQQQFPPCSGPKHNSGNGRNLFATARKRRRIVLTYLRQMHRDFDAISVCCRELAPYSGDPGFAVAVAKRNLLFHFLYATLMVNCLFGALPAAR